MSNALAVTTSLGAEKAFCRAQWPSPLLSLYKNLAVLTTLLDESRQSTSVMAVALNPHLFFFLGRCFSCLLARKLLCLSEICLPGKKKYHAHGFRRGML